MGPETWASQPGPTYAFGELVLWTCTAVRITL